MKRRKQSERFLVITWRCGHDDRNFILSRATITHSLGMAKRLRTINSRYWNIRTTIIPEAILEGIGEISETPKPNRRKLLIENLDKLTVKTMQQ